MKWRSIGAVFMFNGEAAYSARRGAANTDARPTMPPDELLHILAEERPETFRTRRRK